jgi:hypothetical protein
MYQFLTSALYLEHGFYIVDADFGINRSSLVQKENKLKALVRWITGEPKSNSAVQVAIDDSPGWGELSQLPHDYPVAKMQELYNDTLEAWRKNPIAWRIISITTDYVVGDNIRISSPVRQLNRFIDEFWQHPQNRMGLRLPVIADELARAGDIFPVLFRNPNDGMSYIRFVTKDRIVRIETSANDWETEIAFYEKQDLTGESRKWLSVHHPEAAQSDSVMLHYSVNRPIGALMGDSDLTTMIPWLSRYSNMLEDRVRLHWAIRSFLWFITVSPSAVKAKQEQYRNPPESGSVIVKDEGETWEVQSPDLHANDARFDMQAVRQMIDAGSGYPPHWRGEAGDANLATATAMQGPTERHLLRRQQYFVFILQDILFHAYKRAVELGRWRDLKTNDYDQLYTLIVPDVSRWDNESLARAAEQIASALTQVSSVVGGNSGSFKSWMLKLVSKFSGEPLNDDAINQIIAEGAPVGPLESVDKQRSGEGSD